MIDFDTLTVMRIAQSGGIALLFVPISTISYVTLPKELNGDAAALYTMFRNVSGSIGISLSTAAVTERTQVRSAHLVSHLNPFDQGYNLTIETLRQTLLSQGHAAATTLATAQGQVYQMLRTQASVLAYSDVFEICAIGAFLRRAARLPVLQRHGEGRRRRALTCSGTDDAGAGRRRPLVAHRPAEPVRRIGSASPAASAQRSSRAPSGRPRRPAR